MVLVAFDFDGTLADSEMLDRLAARHGVGDAVADITARAMAGELSYGESLRERASLVAGLPSEDAADVYESVRLRDGAGALLRTLDEADVNVVVLTGGFGRGVEAALDAADATVDDVVANRLPEADGQLTGAVEGPLIERPKDEALAAACDDLGVDPSDAVAVGDGANDVPMLRAAGLAVGFDPKPNVREHCDDVVESMAELERLLGERGVLDAQ
jgi:phosphoserine phosphatase